MGPVKLPFTESDLTPLVKRYSSSTIVTMLREIARCKTSKLDWVMLCKRTSTGITNPKEYQALWRTIAYRAELDDSYDENNDSPLEDDSDLEVELDPVPSVSSAVAESIASYVKSDLQQQELEDARLEQTAVERAAADHSSAKLQQSAATQGESAAAAAAASTPLTCSTSTKVPYSGSLNNQADRKRRRLWTPEEDLALIAAVDKCGEGNWTTVLKNHYDFDRTASQLSQRWALIRKRREVQEKAGYGIGSGVSPLASGYKDLRGPESALKSSTSVTLAAGGGGAPSGSQLGTGKPAAGTVATPIKQPVSSTSPSPVPVSKRIPAPPAAASGVSQRLAAPATTAMRVTPGQQQQVQVQQHKQQPRPAAAGPMPAAPRGVARGGPDPMIQAAAMAAGARIAPAATAASLLKAAQSGNVVHIGSGGLPRSKLGQPSSGNNSGIVHYIRTGSGGASMAARGPPHHLAKNQSNRGSLNSGNSSPLSVPTVPVRNNVQASKPVARGSSPQQQKSSAPVVSTTKAAASSSSPALNSSSSSPALRAAAVAPVINKATSTPVSVSTSVPTSKPVAAAFASTKSAPASMSVAIPARPAPPASAPAPASTRPTPASTTASIKATPASTTASIRATPASSGPASSRPTPALGPASTKPTPASASVSTKPTPASAPALAKPAPALAKPAPALAKPAPALAKPAPASTKPTPASTKPTPASISRPGPESSKPTPAAPKPVATSMACGFNTAGSPGDGTT